MHLVDREILVKLAPGSREHGREQREGEGEMGAQEGAGRGGDGSTGGSRERGGGSIKDISN